MSVKEMGVRILGAGKFLSVKTDEEMVAATMLDLLAACEFVLAHECQSAPCPDCSEAVYGVLKRAKQEESNGPGG